MSQLLETLGKGLVSSLWCVFGRRLARLEGKIDAIKIRLAERPDDGDLLLSAAVTCYCIGQYDQALDHIRHLNGLDETSYRFHADVVQACVFEALGKRREAAETLTLLDSCLDRPDPAVLFAIGVLYETGGQTEQAVEYYTRALDASPNLCNAHQRLAAIAIAEGQLDRAIEHYEQLSTIDPGDTDARVILGALLLNDGQSQRAVAEYQVALTIEPDNWAMQNELVDAHVKAGQYDKAIGALKQLLAQQGEFPDTYLQMADLEAKLGNDHRAVECYEKTLELHPNYLEAMVKLGSHHLRVGRYFHAAEWFSRAIDANDRLLNAYVGLAVAQHHTGLEDRAEETIELACSVEPNTTMLFAEIAKLELKASAAEQAKQFLDPDSEGENPAPELVAIQSERFAQALEDYPHRADWHYRYGLLLKAQGKLTHAAGEFQQAIEINPDYVKALVKLGLTLHELGEDDRALRHFERAVVLEPGYADVHYQLGLIYADRGRYDLAVEQFEETLQRSGSSVRARFALAQALENIGLTDQARASWKALVELAPDCEQAKLAQAALSS